MDKDWPWDVQLRRFRTEAAALLGLPKQLPANPSATGEQPLADKDSTPKERTDSRSLSSDLGSGGR
jgi:hypothetical protein